MKKKLTVLVADDDHSHRAMLATLLAEWGYAVLQAADGEEALALEGNPDIALVDVRMPRMDGIETLEKVKERSPTLPVIVMTAFSEIPDAVAAIRKGAYDYLTKPLDFDKLKVTLRNALAHVDLERQNAQLAAGLEDKNKRHGLLGHSPVMLKLGEMIRTIAPTEASTLITGESGTGKELAARAIHEASRRAAGPFIAINCGALTTSLLESELFGHEKGSFTGADKKHSGLFLEATGGSLFLDEIGEMPLEMQVKLLRVLQEKEVLSVGGKKPQPVDCRIIAATNRDLAREVAKGAFREDLYYRLNVVALHMPPLRERTQDIPLLANTFAARFAAINHKRFFSITSEAMRLLQAWRWPGNVRELENIIERAIILMPGEYIGARELPDHFQQQETSPEPAAPVFDPGQGNFPTLDEIERDVILRTLKRLNNNKTETARALGITRKTLHAKLNRYREDSGEAN